MQLKNILIYSYFVLVTCASTSVSASALSNGDFSSGDLSNWTSNGSVNVINSGFNTSGAGLTADLFAGLGVNIPTTLSQTFYLNAGDSLSGQAQWIGWDYLPNNDYGSVSIQDASANTNTLFYADITTYGDFGASAVDNFSFIAPVSGDYTLTAAVANAGDNSSPSELQVANFVVTPVPIPGGLNLFVSALAAVLLQQRRFFKFC